MYFEKRRNKPMVIALIAVMILTSMLPFMIDTALAFSGKVGSTYEVWDAGRIEYGSGEGGYSNSKKCNLGDGLGSRYSYCVQPDKPSPTATTVTVDKVVTDDADTGKWNALRNICYYSPTYPGYDNNVKNIVDNYYTGNAAKDFGIAHLAMSYVYEGRPDDLDTWGDTKASDLGSIWTKAKKLGDALWKDGTNKDDAVPDNFKVFICYMEGVQNMVVGFMQAPGELKFKKSSNLTKISDDNDMYSFSGAEYTVYDDDGDEAGTLTSDADGNSDEIELAEGTYTVKETKAPKGYAMDEETYTVKIESEEETTFKPKETPITARIDILFQKKPAGYNHKYGEGDASLKGAVYKVEYYDSKNAPTDPVKASGSPKATWYFETNEKGEISGSDPKKASGYDSSNLYKDADGNVVFPLGSYVIQEVKAPKGYILNDELVTVKISEDGTDNPYTTSYNKGTSSEEIMRGGVKAAKVDHTRATNVPQGDATLNGAEFKIYNQSEHSVMVNGTEYGSGKAVLTIKTDEEGIAQSDPVLPYGTYIIKETKAPTGYLLNETWEQSFEIRHDKQMFDFSGKKAVSDKVKLGAIKVFKTDSELNRTEPQGDAGFIGAEFTVYNKSPKSVIVNGTEYQPEAAVMTISTGADGTAETDKVLPYGTYLVKETKAPEGYLLNDSWNTTVEVRKDQTTVELTDNQIPETVMKGGVKVAKVDHTRMTNVPQGDAALSGAEFTIYNKSKKSVVVNGNEFGIDEAVLTITANEKGIAVSGNKDLSYGTYLIKETKAPEGYLLNETWEQSFTISEDGVIVDLTENVVDDSVKLGGIKIFKIDNDLDAAEAQGDATLEGAEFTVTNKSKESVIVNGTEYMPNEVVMTISTNAEGIADTDQILPYGTYLIKESVPSTGYLLNTAWEQTVEVREDKVTVELTDSKIKEAVIRGGVKLQKIDNDTNDAYYQGDSTLEGAEFTITNKSAGRVVMNGSVFSSDEDVLVITTDANGKAESAKDALPYGTYSIKETKPSEGYLLNTEWEKTFEIREDGQIIDLTEDPVREAVIRSGVQIVKRDKELGTSEAQGGATLEGIVMTIKNVSDHDVIVRSDIGSDETVDWKTLTSKYDLFEAGKVKRVMPGEDVGSIIVHWNGDLKAYTAETLADDLPYGTYIIRESKTNGSYQRTDKTEHMFEVREDGRIYSYTDEVQELAKGMNEIFAFDDYVYRSDVQGTKIADSTSERFSYVPFKIISVTNGDTHVVVTDKNGFFSTKDRRPQDELDEDEAAETARKINPFDDLLEAAEITNSMIEERYSDIRMGVWFGTGEFGTKAEPDPSVGALPYDTYILEEMPCERNEGYILQKFIFTLDEKSRTGFVDLETITDDCPEIGTTAAVNGKNTDVKVDHEITLIDVVEYTNLKRGETYTVKGKLIDKATGEVVKDAQSNDVTAETTFKAGRSNGKVKVKFIFDGSNMYDMDTVVFESVYDADGHIVARHEDIDDEFQTVTWEKLEPGYEMYKVRTTKAPKKGDQFGFHTLDGVTYDVHVENTGNIDLTMDVTDQFTENPEYFTEPVVKAVKFDGNGIWNNEGDEHTANITLAPEAAVIVTFTATVKDDASEYLANDKYDSDSKDSKGNDTNRIYQFNETDDKDGYINTAKCKNVAYPDPKNPEETKPLEPREDISQTPVQKPVIGTTLADEFGKKEVVLEEKTVLVDTVAYEGLDTSKCYMIEGTLIIKDTGDPLVENGEEVTVMSEAFRPSKVNGFVEIKFEIDTTGLEGKELVAFETAYRINDYVKGMDIEKADKVVVAEHKDINDEGQTVKIVKDDEPETPDEHTTPDTPDEPTTPAPHKTVIPKTGDTTNILLPTVLLAVAITSFVYVMARRKKH